MDSSELLKAFVSESLEMLDAVEPHLVALSGVVGNTGPGEDLIHEIFRLFHTLKGTAGFLGLEVVKETTHEAETLLDLFRKGRANFCPDHAEVLMEVCDFLREVITFTEKGQGDTMFAKPGMGIGKKLKGIIFTLETKCAGSSSVSGSAKKTSKKCGSTPRPQAESPTAPGFDSSAQTAAKASAPVGEIPDFSLQTAVNQPAQHGLAFGTVAQMNFDITSDLIESYVQEGIELLDEVEDSMLKLEGNPNQAPLLDVAFRGLHSFKGNSGFFGFGALERLAHSMETILDSARTDSTIIGESAVRTLLSSLDAIRTDLSLIAAGKKGRIEETVDVHLSRIQGILLGEDNDSPGTGSRRSREASARSDGDGGARARKSSPPSKVGRALNAVPAKERAEFLAGSAEPAEGKIEIVEAQLDDLAGESGDGVSEGPVEKVKYPDGLQNLGFKKQDIRVDIEKLDSLLNLIGELVLAESMVVKNPDIQGMELENFEKASLHLGKIIRDLQDVAMSIRMIPVAGTFRKMIRLVHDLSRRSGKRVELIRVGEETEVDKTVAEQVSDPMVHIIRNSMDHGIESAVDRVKAGKDEAARITLEARYEGSEVWILVRDDGRGLDRRKILSKALEKGLVSGDCSEMPDKAVWKLIFEPGFSTADAISDISGRGVGMDVVKQNIDKLGGKIDIHSVEGQGTLVIMKIPLTLAIIDGMLIRVGESRYIIPTVNIIESFRPQIDDITVTMTGQEVVRIREKLIPVARLHDLHGLTPDSRELEGGILIILEAEGRDFCLFVDEILGQQQTVVKSLGNYIRKIRGVSGCSILGDGRVCLIIDVDGLMELLQSRDRV